MDELEESGELFNYDSLEELVEAVTNEVVDEDVNNPEIQSEVVSRIVYGRWKEKAREIENSVKKEILEDIEDVAEAADIMEDIEIQESFEDSEAQETVEEEVEDEFVDEEVNEIEQEVEMGADISVEDSYGVETLQIGDYQVRLDGRTEGVHKEALYVAQQTGLIEEHGLDEQELNSARQSLRDDGNFSTDYGDLEEADEMPESARREIRQKLESYGYLDSEETVEDSGSDELMYTLTDGTLEILGNDETYEIPVTEEPTLETLGALTGVLDRSRITHEDEETGSRHLNEEHYVAVQTLKSEGVLSGSEAKGFELNIDIPEGLGEDIQEYVRDGVDFSREDVYRAHVEGVNGGKIRVKYDEGYAVVTDSRHRPRPGEDVMIREAGKVEGQRRAKIVDQ